MAAHARGPKPYEELSPSARRLRREEEWFAREHFIGGKGVRAQLQKNQEWRMARRAIESAERKERYRHDIIKWNREHPSAPQKKVPQGADRSPDGEWARALRTVGEKRRTDLSPVGDTPKFTKTEVWYYRRGVPLPERLRAP